MAERCSHVQCSATATARVAFDALACFVWIDPFEADGPRDVSARGAGGLCTRHADRLVPPRGWAVQDRRGREMQLWSDRPATAEPSSATTTSATTGASRRDVRDAADVANGAAASTVAVVEPALPFDASDPSATHQPDGTHATTNADIEEFLAAPTSPLLARAFNAAHSRQAD